MTAPFLDLVDLASERLGAAVVEANAEFCAPKETLTKPDTPIWMEGKYTERGKWMDGWETRRRRDEGDHDWCIIRLRVRGIVRGVDVDTAFFKGNYPESCAIDLGDGSSWREVLARLALEGDAHNVFAIDAAPAATHLRLRIYPDGGVARHFKGNAPGACSLDASVDGEHWRELLAKTRLQPHARHTFEDQVQAIDDVTHVRFNIFPDGGVGRLRLYGRPK